MALSTMALDRISLAKYMAERAHVGQKRKYTGEPYIAHPARVAALASVYFPGSVEMQQAAWLHDVVEDTDTTIDEIGGAFGSIVGLYVYELTKPNEITIPATACLKCLDLIDNLGNIADVAPPIEAIKYLTKKAPQVLDLAERLKGAYPDLIEALVRAWWQNWNKVRAPEIA